MSQRPGCLSGLLQLLVLDRVFDFLQRKFGFGRGASCAGCGCGCLLLILSTALACGVMGGTDWTRIGAHWVMGMF